MSITYMDPDSYEEKSITGLQKAIAEPMSGASSTEDGEGGSVPKPVIGDENKFLRGDGTWQTINTSSFLTLANFSAIKIGETLYKGVIDSDGHFEFKELGAGFYDANNNLIQTLSLEQAGTDASGVKALITDDVKKVVLPIGIFCIRASAFEGCSNLTSIIIPNGVEEILNMAFYGCTSLTSINIPSSVTTIGPNVLTGCNNLTSINIPSSVTSITTYSFSGCNNLTSIIVDANNTVYDSRNNCNAIIETSTNTLIKGCQNTIIPSNVTALGTGAFYECENLTSINIPSGVTLIGSSAFSNCTSLTSVNIPSSVIKIGSSAFRYCSSITSIIIPDSVTTIGSKAFGGIPHIYYNGTATGSPWGALAIN